MDSLLHEQCVLGIEPRDGSDLPRVPIEGLGNSIMLAAPNSSFVRAWLESYRSFDHREWCAGIDETALTTAGARTRSGCPGSSQSAASTR